LPWIAPLTISLRLFFLFFLRVFRQKQRIQSLSQEVITFVDVMCQLIDMVKRPLLLMEVGRTNHAGARSGQGYNYPHATATDAAPRLKEKPRSGSTLLPQAALSAAQQSALSSGLIPSSTLQSALFHSHHKPFVSTAVHTPVQGGAIYNVSEGLFYKKDLRDSHMAAQFFNVRRSTHEHTGEGVGRRNHTTVNAHCPLSSVAVSLCALL